MHCGQVIGEIAAEESNVTARLEMLGLDVEEMRSEGWVWTERNVTSPDEGNVVVYPRFGYGTNRYPEGRVHVVTPAEWRRQDRTFDHFMPAPWPRQPNPRDPYDRRARFPSKMPKLPRNWYASGFQNYTRQLEELPGRKLLGQLHDYSTPVDIGALR